ncbi:MAG: glycosyltransferase family 9 protein, partial [Planctomycetes bacterium]|nr:glycosyltransferase family 9 protein [Planctomycetota bacterium]
LGLTTPRQVISLLRRCDLLISPDNFLMHAAHLTGVQAVILWGPTFEHLYGYPEQIHLRAKPLCEEVEKCIGPKLQTYSTECPKEQAVHCMNRIEIDEIFRAVMASLS